MNISTAKLRTGSSTATKEPKGVEKQSPSENKGRVSCSSAYTIYDLSKDLRIDIFKRLFEMGNLKEYVNLMLVSKSFFNMRDDITIGVMRPFLKNRYGISDRPDCLRFDIINQLSHASGYFLNACKATVAFHFITNLPDKKEYENSFIQGFKAYASLHIDDIDKPDSLAPYMFPLSLFGNPNFSMVLVQQAIVDAIVRLLHVFDKKKLIGSHLVNERVEQIHLCLENNIMALAGEILNVFKMIDQNCRQLENLDVEVVDELVLALRPFRGLEDAYSGEITSIILSLVERHLVNTKYMSTLIKSYAHVLWQLQEARWTDIFLPKEVLVALNSLIIKLSDKEESIEEIYKMVVCIEQYRMHPVGYALTSSCDHFKDLILELGDSVQAFVSSIQHYKALQKK